MENSMQQQDQTQAPARAATPADLDDDTLAFLRRVFGYARAGDAAELASLLGRGLPPNLRNERGDSLLMLACYHGHADAARALLEHGADPEVMNDAGQTPLAGAAFKGDMAVSTLLLEHGAKVDTVGQNGRTALMFAAMFNRTEIARLLLAHGADPTLRDASGNSMVDAADKMGAADTIALLAPLIDGQAGG
jgi:ankyrin repeat protein